MVASPPYDATGLLANYKIFNESIFYINTFKLMKKWPSLLINYKNFNVNINILFSD